MPSIRPSFEEINAEILRLTELATQVIEVGAMGNNNRRAIEVQVTVLKERLSHDKVYDFYGEDAPDYDLNILEAALDAALYLRGEFSDETLSEGWEDLVI